MGVSAHSRIEAVLFDCDGVLVDSEVISMEVDRAHLDGIGLRYAPHEFAQRFIGLNDADYRSTLEADYAQLFGGTIPDGFFQTLKQAYRARLASHLTAIPGANETLIAWPGPKAVASSSALAQLENKLRLTKLWDQVAPHVYSAEQVRAGKPEPDVFLFAAQRLSKPPSACVVIEDSRNGVLAGRAAGMRVWGFTGGGHADAGLAGRLMALGAEQSFASHSELRNALHGLKG